MKSHNLIDFPWCGLRINMRDLSVMVDYSRYSGEGKKVINDIYESNS